MEEKEVKDVQLYNNANDQNMQKTEQIRIAHQYDE